MNLNDKIFIAGINGMVGSAIYRKLVQSGFVNIVGPSHKEVDLRDQVIVHQFFEKEKPNYIFLTAAKVGGILANNDYKADFLYDNLMIQSNVLKAAHKFGVEKLLFLGSSCIYPKMAPQPLKEDYLLTGPLEITNEPYAIAKIAGIKLCEAYRFQYGCNFISVMPTNLYGPNDNYNLKHSHVLPALLKKNHLAKINGEPLVEVWGSGNPLREFLHVDDLADACLFLMQTYDEAEFINIGSGCEISIKDLTHLIKDVVGYTGNFHFDTTKPDGTPRKLLDSSKINNLGWLAKIQLRDGVEQVYKQYILGSDA